MARAAERTNRIETKCVKAYHGKFKIGTYLGFLKGSKEMVAHTDHPVSAAHQHAHRPDARLCHCPVHIHFVLAVTGA